MEKNEKKFDVNDIIREFNKEKEKIKIKLNPLTYFYNKARDYVGVTHENILNQDITPYFWESLRHSIEIDSNPVITIVGATTSGKSAMALTITEFLNKLLEKKFKKKIDMIKSCAICSDQIEFNRFITKGETNMAIEIDEFSQLGKSGYNSTTEENLMVSYINQFAQRNVHLCFATPHGRSYYVNNSNIILNVIGRNDKDMITMCKLVYHDIGDEVYLPLGVINIDVSKTLTSKWYQQYRKKKFARLSLLDKYGVKDIRELEHSEITLDIYNELKEYARASRKRIPRTVINLKSKQILQKKKIFYSILTDMEMGSRAEALLDMEKEIAILQKELGKPLEAERREECKMMLKIAQDSIKESLENEKRNVKIYEEYKNLK